MSSTRVDDTQRWLTDHPEVTHHVVIDDLYWPTVNQPTVNVVKCDDVEGMSWRNFQEYLSMIEFYLSGKTVMEKV